MACEEKVEGNILFYCLEFYIVRMRERERERDRERKNFELYRLGERERE